MRTSIPMLALVVAGCVAPETQFDDTTIVGTVRILPQTKNEKSGDNDDDDNAQSNLPTLARGVVVVSGEISAFGSVEVVEDEEVVTEGDVDWYEVTSELDFEETAFTLTLTGAAEGSGVRFSLYEPGGALTPPELIDEVEGVADAEGNVTVELTVALEADVMRLVRVAGLDGSGAAPYTMVLYGQHPDESNILAAAYPSRDISVRRPLAGGECGPFELDDEFVYTASYRMMLARSVATQPHPFTDLFGAEDLAALGVDEDQTYTYVDEFPGEAFVFAGDWAVLTGALSAGTWYSDDPVAIDIPGSGTVEADPVEVDAFAPLVIGFEIEEVEPNDVPQPDDPGSWDDATPTEVGILSGIGFVDILSGTIALAADDGRYDGDVDAYHFQVPEPMTIMMTLAWEDDATDLDAYILDGDGEFVEVAYGTTNPDIGGGTSVLEPGIDYYFTVGSWLGEAGRVEPYTLSVEQLAP